MNTDERGLIRWIVGIVAMVAAATSFAATPVPSGRWSFVFTDQKGRPDRPIRVFTYRPKQCDTTCPIVFVMHGAKRDAYPYMGWWAWIADLHKVIIVGPQFEERHWPKSAGYNAGDVKEQPDREKWAFSAVEHLFDEVRDGQKDYVIFGHGAGAQFVQRMAIYRPDNRARAMVAASPGWFTMPEWRKDKAKEPYPYTMFESPAGEAELRAALPRRLVIVVHEKDEAPDAENLEKRSEVVKQGETRLDRGENFIKAATAASQELGVKLGWELNEAPDTIKDNDGLMRYAAETVFGKR